MTGFNSYRYFLFRPALALALLWVVAPAGAAAAEQGAEQTVEAVRQRLDELRQQHGVYDPVLIEAWSDLAARRAADDDHEQAAEAWQEALQISRISDGLYDLSQLRIIEQLAMAHEKAGDTEEAETYHYLLFHTRSRLHEPDSEEAVDAVIDWSDWKLRRSTASESGIHPGALSDGELESLWRQQSQAMEVLESRQGNGEAPGGVRYGSLLYLRTLTGLGMASRVLQRPSYLFDPPLVQQYVTRRVCRTVSDSSGGTRQECTTRQVENPQYRRAQVAERSQQAERSLRAARQALSRLEGWQEQAAVQAVSAGELQALDRVLSRLEREVRRSTFGRW